VVDEEESKVQVHKEDYNNHHLATTPSPMFH